jgi:hypothetical protein
MPSVLVTRATFPDIARRLREHFDVEDNPSDDLWDPAELRRRLQGRQGVMSHGSDRRSIPKYWRLAGDERQARGHRRLGLRQDDRSQGDCQSTRLQSGGG